MKAVIFTLGCKVNEVESAALAAALEGLGWETDIKLGYADVYVLNTCAVTREAEKKSRQLIARARKFNPAAKIFVCGCASERDGAAFSERGADFVCGARKKEEIIEAFCRMFGGKAAGMPYPKQVRSRAFIKIEDGCNSFCSYCIIPYLRGRERSRSVGDILGEIAVCASPEIVINGINISAYNDGGVGLSGLIKALAGVEKRIRLGSLECGVITPELLERLAALYDFAPQFHLSLQSGSDGVLKAMNRRYTRAQYLEKCAMIYEKFPSAAITTDIIAGFPAESEEDFLCSLSIIEEARFARVHAFCYSPREGTAAFKMGQLPAEVRSDRLHRLLAAAERCEERFIGANIGCRAEIIAEDFGDGYTSGYTGNYIRVFVPQRLQSGRKYGVILKERCRGGAIGALL